MAADETGFEDVFYDFDSVQYPPLTAANDHQYARDAKGAGRDDLMQLFEDVMNQASRHVRGSHKLLSEISSSAQPVAAKGGDGDVIALDEYSEHDR